MLGLQHYPHTTTNSCTGAATNNTPINLMNNNTVNPIYATYTGGIVIGTGRLLQQIIVVIIIPLITTTNGKMEIEILIMSMILLNLFHILTLWILTIIGLVQMKVDLML